MNCAVPVPVMFLFHPVSEAPEEKKGEKVYLYTHLKQQPIW